MDTENGANAAALVNNLLETTGLEELSFLQQIFLGNTVLEWLIAVVLLLVIASLLRLAEMVVVHRLKALSKRTKMNIDDVLVKFLQGISWYFYSAVSLFCAVQHLALPELASMVVKFIFLTAIAVELIKIAEKIVVKIISAQLKRSKSESQSLLTAAGLITRVVMWAVDILMILSNMGVNVTSLIASLGIGGLAVSLALQPVFQDMFSSFSIILDKPFEEGDFIEYGDFKGTVKKIGLKTTRLQALQGEEIVIPNTELTSGKIQNFKKLQRRRIVFGIGLTYDTPAEKLREIPQIIEDIITDLEDVTFDRAHFKEFADSSLNYEIVYFMEVAEFPVYMDRQETMNIRIHEEFQKRGLEMAFPSRTVYMANAS